MQNVNNNEEVEDEPPLAQRLQALAFGDQFAQPVVFVLIAFYPAALTCPVTAQPFGSAMSPDVQGLAITVLLLAFLLCLDCCKEAVRKINKACADVDANLSVSWRMTFTDEVLNRKYHQWLERNSVVVRWQPCMAFAVDLLGRFRVAAKVCNLKCSWQYHSLLGLISLFLGLRVFLGLCGLSAQHKFSLAAQLVTAVSFFGLLVAKDTCLIHSFGSSAGPAGHASILSLKIVVHCTAMFCLIPVSMDYLHMQAGIVFLSPGCSSYLQFLVMNGGFDLSISDPKAFGLLAASLSSAAICLAAVALRYRLAESNMRSFLGCVQQQFHHRD